MCTPKIVCHKKLRFYLSVNVCKRKMNTYKSEEYNSKGTQKMQKFMGHKDGIYIKLWPNDLVKMLSNRPNIKLRSKQT